MAKPQTEFADEDLAIARRALWLLEGHGPRPKLPPLDIGMDRFTKFSGSDGFALPLAHFGVMRYLDATRASSPQKTPTRKDAPPNHVVAKAPRRLAEGHAAAPLEKRARTHLSEALLRSRTAGEAWQAALARREEGWARTPGLSPILGRQRLKILDALLTVQDGARKALVLMDALMRELPPVDVIDAFVSTFGLPLAQRNQVLGDQALRLSEAGISVEDVAYVMGWDDGKLVHAKDRTRQRIKAAAVRKKPRAR